MVALPLTGHVRKSAIRRGRMPVAGLQGRQSVSRKATSAFAPGNWRNPQAVLRLLTVLRDGTDTFQRPDRLQGRSEPLGAFPHPEGHEQAGGRSGHLDPLLEGARVPAKDATPSRAPVEKHDPSRHQKDPDSASAGISECVRQPVGY